MSLLLSQAGHEEVCEESRREIFYLFVLEVKWRWSAPATATAGGKLIKFLG